MKKKISPPLSPLSSLQDRMDMASLSLAKLKSSAFFSVDLATGFITSQKLSSDDSLASSTCSTQPVLSDFQQLSTTGPIGIHTDVHVLAAPLGISQKPFKIARKPHNVTQLVLVDERDSGKGFRLARPCPLPMKLLS
jgi:hypothetical protein